MCHSWLWYIGYVLLLVPLIWGVKCYIHIYMNYVHKLYLNVYMCLHTYFMLVYIHTDHSEESASYLMCAFGALSVKSISRAQLVSAGNFF